MVTKILFSNSNLEMHENKMQIHKTPHYIGFGHFMWLQDLASFLSYTHVFQKVIN